MKRSMFGVLGIVLVLALLVTTAGCGGDESGVDSDDEATGITEPPGEETPAVTGPTEDQLLALLEESVIAWTEGLMAGAGMPYEVTAQIAQDSAGAWWGVATVQSASTADAAYEPITYWCAFDGAEWTGEAQDPEPPSPDTYFPADVVEVLF